MIQSLDYMLYKLQLHMTPPDMHILFLSQTLHFGEQLATSLIWPTNQVQKNGIIVDDVPKHLAHRYKATYSIFVPAARH